MSRNRIMWKALQSQHQVWLAPLSLLESLKSCENTNTVGESTTHCTARAVNQSIKWLTPPALAGESTREHMELHQVTHLDEMAVCNDGSPGAYYHRPGTAANSTRHVCLSADSHEVLQEAMDRHI